VKIHELKQDVMRSDRGGIGLKLVMFLRLEQEGMNFW